MHGRSSTHGVTPRLKWIYISMTYRGGWVPSGASTGVHAGSGPRSRSETVWRQRCAHGCFKGKHSHHSCAHRAGRQRTGTDQPDNDRTGRYTEQGQARRECHSRRFNGSSPGRRPVAGYTALRVPRQRYRYLLPVPMMNVLNGGYMPSGRERISRST